MRHFVTPGEAAIAALGSGVVPHVVIEGDLAIAVVVDAQWQPPFEQAWVIERTERGWHVAGSCSVHGTSWSQRCVALCAAVHPDVMSATIRYVDKERTVPARNGYIAFVSRSTAGEEQPELISFMTRDGVTHQGWPDLPDTARGSDASYDPQIEKALHDARHWVWATQRQIERFVAEFRTQPMTVLPPTPAQQRILAGTYADAQFLLNAAHHAKKALDRLGHERLSDALIAAITTLRNVHEHWEKERATFEGTGGEKKRSGKRFADNYPDAAPWTYSFGSTGHFISVLRLEDLWEELDTIERRLSALHNDVMAASHQPHMPEDPERPPRPMPVPAEGPTPRVIGMSVAAQDFQIPSV